MSKQIISMGKTGHPLTVEKLSEVITSKIKEGVLTGKEVISDYENTCWCLMGIKKQGKLVMLDFKEDNEEYMNMLEEEGFYMSDRCDPFDELDETFDAIAELEDSNDDIIETVEKLEGEKNE